MDLNKIDEQKETSQGSVIALSGLHYVCKTKKLDEVTTALPEFDFIHWVSNGDWSMHELLLACLQHTGDATVYISSYAFSEHPARLIADLKQSGVIQKLYCLIDSRIDTRSAGALQLIQNTADKFVLMDTHAKVTIIKNDRISVCIVCSANYTTNRRYEAGFVSTMPALSLFHEQWMQHELDNAE